MAESAGTGNRRSRKGSEASRHIYEYLKSEYRRAYDANLSGEPVGWGTAFSPVEILHAMDIVPVYPENYACLVSARQKSVEYQQDLEAIGFSKDTCSYFRTVSGAMVTDKSALNHPFARPNVLLTHTGLCDCHQKWMEFTSRKQGTPMFVLDLPYNAEGLAYDDVPQAAVDYYVAQLQELIAFLEAKTGKRMDPRRLQEAVANSDETSRLWFEVLDMRKRRPCPLGAEDTFTDIYLLVTSAGAKPAVDLMRELRDEVKARVEAGQGLVAEEKFRLYWDMVPQWYNMGLFNYFAEQGAVFVAEYFNWLLASRMNPEKPLEALARKYISRTWGNLPLPTKSRYILNHAREYQLDGALIFSPWSCRPYMVGQMDIQRDLEAAGVPTLLLVSDQADWRLHSEAQTRTRVDAFIETLAAARR